MNVPNIVILTGAGVSAESGLRTFRAADGLWEDHRIEDVCTPEAYARDAELVHLNGYAHAALPWRVPVVVVAHSCVLSWWQAVFGEAAPARYAEYRRHERASTLTRSPSV